MTERNIDEQLSFIYSCLTSPDLWEVVKVEKDFTGTRLFLRYNNKGVVEFSYGCTMEWWCSISNVSPAIRPLIQTLCSEKYSEALLKEKEEAVGDFYKQLLKVDNGGGK